MMQTKGIHRRLMLVHFDRAHATRRGGLSGGVRVDFGFWVLLLPNGKICIGPLASPDDTNNKTNEGCYDHDRDSTECAYDWKDENPSEEAVP